MASFFDSILRLNYSNGLHEHLKGLNASTCDYYSGTDLYTWITMWVFPLAFLGMLNFYKVLLDRPNFAFRWVWALNILAICGITSFMAYMRSANDLSHTNYCKQLYFNTADCALFGATVAIYTLVLCLVFSLILKRWSLNNKKIPF